MKYIKINTPLQVVGGFTVNEAIVVLANETEPYELNKIAKCTGYVIPRLYKDYNAFNTHNGEIKIYWSLPHFRINSNLTKVMDDVLELYLSILKANEYDAEIVDTTQRLKDIAFKAAEIAGKSVTDTDAPKVDDCVSFGSGTTVNGEVTIKVEIDKDKLKELVKEMVTVTTNKIEAYVVDKDLKDAVLFTPEYLAEVTDIYNKIKQDLNPERNNESHFVDRIVSALYRIEQSISEINKSKVTFRTK